MKKVKQILVALVVAFILPVVVSANEKINVYVFKGETCPYCAKAIAFLQGLDDEYQSYFNLVEKEVWYDENNAADMQKVANYFNESVSGVPYIIIGEKTFQGFDETQYGEQIKTAIKNAYEDDDYQDIVASILGGETLKKDSNSSTAIVIIIAVIAGIVFLVYMARDGAGEEATTSEEKVVKTSSKPSTKTTARKSTSTKKTANTTKKKTTTKK